MSQEDSWRERRIHTRFALGLPIRVHFEGDKGSADIELSDVSMGGGRFRGDGGPVRLGEAVAFGFVLPGASTAVARAHVVRVDPDGFAVRLERANDAFRGFVEELANAFPPGV